MPTRTFLATKTSLFAVTGSTELGGGQDQHLPYGGPWNGYTFISALMFALDFSGMKRITGASLYMKTTGQVHIGFASPYVYVYRATAAWTANGSSSSSEGGSGWGTSPTVYPGPPYTTTGGSSRSVTGSENAWAYPDVSAIVRAWAPASVEGGGGLANYGVRISAKSGTRGEFYGYPAASGNRPYIVVSYDTDTPPPAPTITDPPAGSTTADTTPTLACTCVDPDGDPIEVGEVEVRQGATVVWSGSSGASLTAVPPTPLPSGLLTQRWRARAAGVFGPWSADVAFTIDRPPTVTGWTAPTGNVSGTRRPVHTFTASDPDGTPLDQYDIEVYATTDGITPVGDAVYRKLGQTAGIAGGTVNHTPSADLPGGPLVARSRVLSGPQWSAWSAYRAYTVVLVTSTIVWQRPAAVGAGLVYRNTQFSDLTIPVGTHQMRADFVVTPPAGKTITRVDYTITQLDPASVVIASGNAGTGSPAGQGGAYSIYGTVQAAHASNATRWKIDLSVTDSGGGVATTSRTGMVAYGEWYGAVALGDQVSDLAVAETFVAPASTPDQMALLWYRAQSSPTAPNGAAVWRRRTDLAALVGELPPTNAYLGVRARLNRMAPPASMIVNGDFETGSLAPWIVTGTGVGIGTDANAPAGSKMCVVNGDGGPSNPGVTQKFTVLPGATYRASAWGRVAAGTGKARLQIVTRNAAGSIVNSSAGLAETAAAAWTYLEAYVAIPADGSVASIDFILRIPTTVATDSVRFDGAALFGAATVSVEGIDKLALTWKSLG